MEVSARFAGLHDAGSAFATPLSSIQHLDELLEECYAREDALATAAAFAPLHGPVPHYPFAYAHARCSSGGLSASDRHPSSPLHHHGAPCGQGSGSGLRSNPSSGPGGRPQGGAHPHHLAMSLGFGAHQFRPNGSGSGPGNAGAPTSASCGGCSRGRLSRVQTLASLALAEGGGPAGRPQADAAALRAFLIDGLPRGGGSSGGLGSGHAYGPEGPLLHATPVALATGADAAGPLPCRNARPHVLPPLPPLPPVQSAECPSEGDSAVGTAERNVVDSGEGDPCSESEREPTSEQTLVSVDSSSCAPPHYLPSLPVSTTVTYTSAGGPSEPSLQSRPPAGRAATSAGILASSSSFRRALPSVMLTRLRKAASDVVTQLKSLGTSRTSSRTGTGTSTPATATAAAAMPPVLASLRPSVEVGGLSGTGRSMPGAWDCTSVTAAAAAAATDGSHNASASGGRGPYLRSPLRVSSSVYGQHETATFDTFPQLPLAATAAAYATAPAALVARPQPPLPPCVSLASRGSRHSAHAGDGGGFGPGRGDGGAGAVSGSGSGGALSGSGQYMDERGGVDLLPDMWDLAQVWDELDDVYARPPGAAAGGRRGGAAAAGDLRSHHHLYNTAPVALLDPESPPPTHGSSYPRDGFRRPETSAGPHAFDEEQEYILSELVHAARRNQRQAERRLRAASPRASVFSGGSTHHAHQFLDSAGSQSRFVSHGPGPPRTPQQQHHEEPLPGSVGSISAATMPPFGGCASAGGLRAGETGSHSASAPSRLDDPTRAAAVATAAVAAAAATAADAGVSAPCSMQVSSSLLSPAPSALVPSSLVELLGSSAGGRAMAAAAAVGRSPLSVQSVDGSGFQELAWPVHGGLSGGDAGGCAFGCALPVSGGLPGAPFGSLARYTSGSSALNSGVSGCGVGVGEVGPELSMIWPLVMPTPVPAASLVGDGAGCAAPPGAFTLRVLVGCGCGGAAGCEAAADAATQQVSVMAMLSGAQLAQVPLQPEGGCQAAALRLPLLPSMQLVSVFTSSAAAVGPAANLLAVSPAMAAELHDMFAERVAKSLARLTAHAADGAASDAASTGATGTGDSAAVAADLAALRRPSAERPPWAMSVPVWAACRTEWRSWAQPLLSDMCYLLLCVPNCFSHGLVQWDRAMYCETLARLLGQLERYKLWETLAALLEYCGRAGLLEGALHDEISIKAVGGGGGDGSTLAAAVAGCGVWSVDTSAAESAAQGHAGGGGGDRAGGGSSGGRARRRATLAALVLPSAADVAAARALTAWRRRSVDEPGLFPLAAGGAAPASKAGEPLGPGLRPAGRDIRSQVSIGRVLSRVMARLGRGEDQPQQQQPGAAAAGAAAGDGAPPRMGTMIENAAVLVAFAGVMLQTLL
ncbi:hypothetical protein GPECTOR_74g675 [Gonium pectorale]|uniref:Uncharacterized protein n=1 Tax=Gonium pectorale TaxID=33097 RepID=A0A150G2P3_GONPE|nr:hypothetical protein GPECTOR_74g675 [Gonium pectorale]|eukprot:KXZ44061.1 hypothetical protein GPECTOR_74g675 [Gonium pectorale]